MVSCVENLRVKMEIFRVVFCALVFTLLTSARYINQDAVVDDEQDLEIFLEDYYDDLVSEYKTLVRELEIEQKEAGHVKNLIQLVAKEKTDLKEEAALEAKINRELIDYDYMSDAAEPPPQDQSKLNKEGVNVSWSAATNGTAEDPMLAKVQRESALDPEATYRSRELRLNAIRDAILELRGGGPAPDVNGTMPSTRGLKELFENHKSLIPNSSTNSYTEKVQSFYPSCGIPRPADEDFWNDPLAMNLLFDVKYPTANNDMITDVVSAKLRLYKISQVNATVTPERGIPKPNSFGVLATPTMEDDRLLRVSVYWYTLISRRNRSKRKLMDSQMFNTIEGAWMEFNIRNAVKTWKNSGINYGLVVTVEDEDGALLPTHKYIHAMNCSKEAVTVKPLPSIFVDAMKQHPDANQTQMDGANMTDSNGAFPYPNYLFPILDVTTAEVPVHEADSLINRMSASVPSGYGTLVARNSSANRSRAGQDRNSVFNMVGIGSPSSGQNRNNLVPILTKNDVVTLPEDVRMKNELIRAQAERADQPRRRHSRKHSNP